MEEVGGGQKTPQTVSGFQPEQLSHDPNSLNIPCFSCRKGRARPLRESARLRPQPSSRAPLESYRQHTPHSRLRCGSSESPCSPGCTSNSPELLLIKTSGTQPSPAARQRELGLRPAGEDWGGGVQLQEPRQQPAPNTCPRRAPGSHSPLLAST